MNKNYTLPIEKRKRFLGRDEVIFQRFIGVGLRKRDDESPSAVISLAPFDQAGPRRSSSPMGDCGFASSAALIINTFHT